MRWFLRDNKFYIGPVSDLQIDVLLTRDPFASCGIACRADAGKVETYLTLPVDSKHAKDLDKIRLQGVLA